MRSSPRAFANNDYFSYYIMIDGYTEYNNGTWGTHWDSCGISPGVYIDIDACGVNSDGTIDDNAGYSILSNSGGRSSPDFSDRVVYSACYVSDGGHIYNNHHVGWDSCGI